MPEPLCFVLMPFGRKPDPTGALIDFDSVYRGLIVPAIASAGLQPLRADEEFGGGIIHKPMLERLVLCDMAVADLTTANANVFYELGVRHAVRPFSTVLIFAEGSRLPFDVAPLRGLPYKLGAAGTPIEADTTVASLAARLREARRPATDSPLFQLLDGYAQPDLARLKTDVFRDRVEYATATKARLAAARRGGADAVRAVELDLGDLARVEAGVLVDLLLSYRAAKAFEGMARLVGEMPAAVAGAVLVQEQLGFALNRLKRRDEATSVLEGVIARRGPSSETLGLLGRVYKDRWEEARGAGHDVLARGLLEKAITTYVAGFEADWRDAYPGINAVTLMELREPPDPRQQALLPVVRYAVDRRLAGRAPDYWDHASSLEIAVLARDRGGALTALSDALAAVREPWEPESTQRNLRLIREARDGRGEDVAWIAAIEAELEHAATGP